MYGKIWRHERYFLKHRPKKGCNIRLKSIEDPVKRLEKIAPVSAMLEINQMIERRTNIDEYCRLKYMEMLTGYEFMDDWCSYLYCFKTV